MNEADSQTKRQIKVPDLPQELFNDQFKHVTYTTEHVPPFLCTTKSIVTERYNSDPNLLRSTFYILPVSEYSLECCALPLALVATPFSDRAIATEAAGLERCNHCRSYFCCFTRHIEGAYVCNICGKKSTGPVLHQDNLNYSTYEYTVPEAKPILRPAFVFVFDFTFPWNAELADTVLSVCQDENFQFLYENVSFVVLNHGISVFTKEGRHTPSLSKIRILGSVVPFISTNIIFKSTDTESIRRVIETVKKEKTNLKEQNTSGFLRIMRYVSRFCSGAKVALFSSVKHADLNYEEFLADAKNVSINIFTHAGLSSASSLPNALHSLAFYSSGTVFSYAKSEIDKCKKDLLFISTSRAAFDLSIVLKVSDSLVKTGIIAPSIDENLSVTHLNAMDPHSTATFLLSLSGLSKNIKYCQMQISFTDFDGFRKIRVLNHSFTTGSPTQFYSALAADTIFAVLCKIFVSESTPLENPLVKSLIFYRSKCSTSTVSTQFVLPESLKCLPVLVQAFAKNFFVQSFTGTQAGAAFRASNYKARIVNMNAEQNLRFFYPRLFSLTDYTTLVQTPGIRLSMANILDTEVYVMDNAFTIFVYAGRSVDPLLIKQLFDFSGEPAVQQGGSEEAALLNRAISEISAHYNRPMETRVIQAGGPGETEFLGYMVEDAISGSCDYIDFIFKTHFKVQKG